VTSAWPWLSKNFSEVEEKDPGLEDFPNNVVTSPQERAETMEVTVSSWAEKRAYFVA
jgi:hypothetical protein